MMSAGAQYEGWSLEDQWAYTSTDKHYEMSQEVKPKSFGDYLSDIPTGVGVGVIIVVALIILYRIFFYWL